MARKPRSPFPPFRVALTGGIASGKSTVAGLFAALGVPIIDTDLIARDVVAPGMPGLAAVAARFGPGVLAPDGALDRARLRALVFADPAARKDLEGLLHPLIREQVAYLSARAGGDYQIIVVPLLIETGTAGTYDRVLVVDVEPEAQLARLLLRDRETRAGAEAILAAQTSREVRLQHGDDVIHNDADVKRLAQQVETLHGQYKALSAQREKA